MGWPKIYMGIQCTKSKMISSDSIFHAHLLIKRQTQPNIHKGIIVNKLGSREQETTNRLKTQVSNITIDVLTHILVNRKSAWCAKLCLVEK
jgi:hypothetical protein